MAWRAFRLPIAAALLAALVWGRPAYACGPFVGGYPVAPCPPPVVAPPPAVYFPYAPYAYPYTPYAYAYAPYVVPTPGIVYGYRAWGYPGFRYQRWYDRPRIEGYTLR